MAENPERPVVVGTITECTPQELLVVEPCLNCLSESQLLMILYLLFVWRIDGDLDDAITDLENSTCFKCASDKQLLTMIDAILMQWLGITSDNWAEFKVAMGCLACADPKLIRAATVKKICEYIQSLQLQ